MSNNGDSTVKWVAIIISIITLFFSNALYEISNYNCKAGICNRFFLLNYLNTEGKEYLAPRKTRDFSVQKRPSIAKAMDSLTGWSIHTAAAKPLTPAPK